MGRVRDVSVMTERVRQTSAGATRVTGRVCQDVSVSASRRGAAISGGDVVTERVRQWHGSGRRRFPPHRSTTRLSGFDPGQASPRSAGSKPPNGDNDRRKRMARAKEGLFRVTAPQGGETDALGLGNRHGAGALRPECSRTFPIMAAGKALVSRRVIRQLGKRSSAVREGHDGKALVGTAPISLMAGRARQLSSNDPDRNRSSDLGRARQEAVGVHSWVKRSPER
jgi:hypothetical protein